MKRERVKKLLSGCVVPIIPLVDMSTNLTKGIRFTANTVSRTMDTAAGGYFKHGGLHRLYGGHDISNLTYWRRFGSKFPTEIGKDMLTTNGVPYPKLELAVKRGWIKASTAQKFGTWNIGKAGAAGLGLLDSALTIRKFIVNREQLNERWISTSVKGAVKIATGIPSGNIPLTVAGAIDLSLVAFTKIESQVQLSWSNDWCNFADRSFNMVQYNS